MALGTGVVAGFITLRIYKVLKLDIGFRYTTVRFITLRIYKVLKRHLRQLHQVSVLSH